MTLRSASMKILTGAEMRDCDQAALVHTPNDGLMELASREVAGCVLRELLHDPAQFPERLLAGETLAVILAGRGNNGGDGFAIARHLLCAGMRVKVVSFSATESLSGMVLMKAKQFLAAGGEISVCGSVSVVDLKLVEAEFSQAGIVFDAIFGAGFRGELPKVEAAVVELLNQVRAQRRELRVVAVDIPSGVNCDTGEVPGTSVRADQTVAIQALKFGHLCEPGASMCGQVRVVDAGIATRGLGELNLARDCSVVLRRLVGVTERGVNRTAHKGKRGHILVIGGAEGKSGAAKLAALAALKCGGGLATVAMPRASKQCFQFEQWEIMTAGVPSDERGGFALTSGSEMRALLEKKSAVVIGPGFGQGDSATDSLNLCYQALIGQARENGISFPIVVDADALVPSVSPPPGSILTPHPGEMARMLGVITSEVERDRVGAARLLAARFQCVVVLKGAGTIIATPSGEIWINPHKTNILATAGSGDVLSGVIASMVAQGASGIEAARVGVFLHGNAGMLLEERLKGGIGATAIDIAQSCGESANRLLSARHEAAAQSVRPLPGVAFELESAAFAI